MSKRTPKEIARVASKVLAFVKKHPACNAEAISVGTKLTNAEIFLPIKYLLRLKLIKGKGQARGVRYTAGPKDGGIIITADGLLGTGVVVMKGVKKK